MCSIPLVPVLIGGDVVSVVTALPPLYPLSLGGNQLGDEGVISLCEGLKSCTSLQKLE